MASSRSSSSSSSASTTLVSRSQAEAEAEAVGRPTTGCSRQVVFDSTAPDPPRGIIREGSEKPALSANRSLSFCLEKTSVLENEQRGIGKKRITAPVCFTRRRQQQQQQQTSENAECQRRVSHAARSTSGDAVSVSLNSPARCINQRVFVEAPVCSCLQKSQSDIKSPAVYSNSTAGISTFENSASVSFGNHHRVSRRPFKKVGLSLHCWVLAPLVVILVSVYVVPMVLTCISSRDSSRDAFLSLHDVVVAKMKVSVGRLTFGKMKRMAVATGSMYFSNNTFPNPATDRLMPLENGMMLRLCAVLRDVDSRRRVSSLGVVSLTRYQAAICALSDERPGDFIGVQSRSGAIKYYYRIDQLTLEAENSRVPLPISNKLDIGTFTMFQRFDSVIKIWNESLKKKKSMKPSEYWVTPRKPPTYMAFVYPFFETYDDGSSGIGYLFATMFTGDLTGIRGYNATNSGIRVMLVNPNATAERLLVLSNSWGQPLSNVTSVWWTLVRGESVRFMHVDDVADPLMRSALEHIDLRAAINSDKGKNATFIYDGFDALITAEHVFTESGVDYLLVVVTSRSYYLGPALFSHGTAIAVGLFMLIAVIAACIAFVECCLFLPLRSIRSELKLALSGAPANDKKRHYSMLREVNELGDVCVTLRRRMDEVRSFMPHRLFTENVTAKTNSEVVEGSTYDVGSTCGHSGNKLEHVACSVAYVYYTPRTTRNPTNAVVKLMMQTVVQIATECGGCFEVQRPDYCVISFGVRSKDREFADEAAWAVKFALQLREKLEKNAELAGLYRVIVESGRFLSGVISGDDRSHFVLLCRNLHQSIGDFLPQYDVVAAVTEETALLVRGRYRLLPFETVCLERNHEEFVKLHEVLGGDAGAQAWYIYERSYGEAYDMMMRGDYAVALQWWDEANAVEQDDLVWESPFCRSSQAMRLQRECVARIRSNDTTPFVRLPHKECVEEADFEHSLDVLYSGSGGGSDDVTLGTTSSSMVSFQHGLVATVTLASNDATISDLKPGCLPKQIKDHLGDVWTPSLRPIEGTATDITPVYMAISATGTLAVLKLCPLKEAASRLPRAEVESALNELQTLDADESIVQCLSYCYLSPRHVVLVMQYVPGGTLRELKTRYGRQLPLMVVRRNVASILRALAHLHSRGLVHGRLSPENVMVGVEGRCRVKGMLLGAASLIVQHDSFYMSPEVAAGGARTMANDMYALGLLLLAMLTDYHPWRWVAHVAVNRSQNELAVLLSDISAFRVALQAEQLEPVPPPEDLDSTLRGVLNGCLCPFPGDRLTAAEILETYNL